MLVRASWGDRIRRAGFRANFGYMQFTLTFTCSGVPQGTPCGFTNAYDTTSNLILLPFVSFRSFFVIFLFENCTLKQVFRQLTGRI